MRCLEESRALKEEREGKEVGSRAAAGLWVGEAHAMRRVASLRRWRQSTSTGGRQASRARMEVGVESKLLVTHPQTRCQKELIDRVVRWLGTRRSAP